MTTAELKDAAIFVMAYSFLQMDSTEKLGLFINKKASKFIDELIEAMTPIVGVVECGEALAVCLNMEKLLATFTRIRSY